MADFIGREQELARLGRFFSSVTENAAMVCGARRVGKTSLVLESLRASGTRGLYFACREVPEAMNARALCAQAGDALGKPVPPFPQLFSALDWIFRAAADVPLVLVLDDWPRLAGEVQGAASILQALLDRYRGNSRLKIVLLGPGALAESITSDAPLYGRLGLVLKLRPMDYLEASHFYPALSVGDRIRCHAVFGGVPGFCSLIDPGAGFRKNLMRLVTAPGARLGEELWASLRQAFPKSAGAAAVLEEVARGAFRFRDVLARTGLSSSALLSQVLGRLVASGLLSRAAPAGEEDNRQKAGYVFADPLARFYFRYVFPHLSERQTLSPEVFFERFVAEDFERSFVPERFADLCLEHLVQENRAGRIEPPLELLARRGFGAGSEGADEILGRDARGAVLFKVFSSPAPVTGNELERAVAGILSRGASPHRLGFFSRAGFAAGAREKAVRVAQGRPVAFYAPEALYSEKR